MMKCAVGLALVALSTGVSAQDTNWGFFEPDGGTMQAGIAGENGSQLILKCDKTGKHRVYAVVVATRQLAAARGASGYESGKVTLTFDGKAPMIDDWRFNDKFAMAMDDQNLRAMSRFGERLADAKTLELIFEPRNMAAAIAVEFEVSGAREAMNLVYESCKDTIPFD